MKRIALLFALGMAAACGGIDPAADPAGNSTQLTADTIQPDALHGGGFCQIGAGGALTGTCMVNSGMYPYAPDGLSEPAAERPHSDDAVVRSGCRRPTEALRLDSPVLTSARVARLASLVSGRSQADLRGRAGSTTRV